MRRRSYGLIVRLVCLVGVGRLWGVECDDFSVSVMERYDEVYLWGMCVFQWAFGCIHKGFSIVFLLEGMGLVLSRLFILMFDGMDLLD